MSDLTLTIGSKYAEKDANKYPNLANTAQTYHTSEVSITKPDNFFDWRAIFQDNQFSGDSKMRPIHQVKTVTGEFSNLRRAECEVAYQYGMDIMMSSKGDDSDSQLRGYKTDTFRARMDDRESPSWFRTKFFQFGNEIDLLDRPDLGLDSWNHPAKAVAWGDKTAELLEAWGTEYNEGNVQASVLVHGGFANLPRCVGYLRQFVTDYPELASQITHLNGHQYERDPRLFNEFNWMSTIESLTGGPVVFHMGEANKNFVFGGLDRLPEAELICYQLATYIEMYRHRPFIHDFTIQDDTGGTAGAGHYNQEGTASYDSLQVYTEFLSKCGSDQYEITGDDPLSHGLASGMPWCTYVGLFKSKGKYQLIITKPTLDASKSAETYINYKYHEGMVLPGGWTAGQTSERDALIPVIDAASSGNQKVRLEDDSFLLNMNFEVLHTVGTVIFHSRKAVTMTPDSAVIVEFSPA